MEIIEIVYILLFVIISILSIRSDLREGLIHNNTMAIFALVSCVLNIIYYGVLYRGYFLPFLVNVLIVAAVSMVLYFSHSFAGGDCKLLIVMSLLIPAGFYWDYNNSLYTLFSVVAFACFYGYIFLLISSLWKIVSGEIKVTRKYVSQTVFLFLKSFASALIFISALNLIAVFAGLYRYRICVWVIRIACLILAWVIGRFSALKRWPVLLSVFVLDMILCAILKVIPLSLNPENYILVIVLLLCQLAIKTNLYETIEINNLKKGMILTTFSSLLLQNSRVRGLPSVSTEDLSSRLTDDEIESIKRWANSRDISELSVVRKIPFAIFIVMGYWTYFVLWSWMVR